MQCGEDGVGRRKSGSIAYNRATFGPLAQRRGLESDGVGGRGVGGGGHGGWAEVYGRVEERRGRHG